MKTKYGTIQKIEPGKYRVWWGTGTDAHGKRKRQSKTIRGTLEDAKRYLAEQRATGFETTAATTWNAYYESVVVPSFDGLAAKTVQEYQRQWLHDLKPAIGTKHVRDTTPQAVNRVLARIESPTVQRHVFALLRKMCNMAVQDGLLKANPCTRQTRLKPYRKPQAAIVRNVAGFMTAIRGIKYEPALLLMLGGGLRLEEVCGLMWRDISPCLVSGGNLVQVDVKQAVTMAYNRPVTKETKNETSTRIVVVGNPFASRLDAIRGDDAAPLVECAPATFTHNWRAWCARHGLEYVRPKDLRASYATICGEAGCIDSLVAMQMGHSDGTTKGRHYQRATVRGGALVAETLADYLAELAANGT